MCALNVSITLHGAMDMKKAERYCPECGAYIPFLARKCIACGHESEKKAPVPVSREDSRDFISAGRTIDGKMQRADRNVFDLNCLLRLGTKKIRWLHEEMWAETTVMEERRQLTAAGATEIILVVRILPRY